MEIITIALLLSFGIGIFTLSHLVKNNIFAFISGILFFLVGLSIFVSGIDIKTGFKENYNLNEANNVTSGEIITNYEYSDRSPIFDKGMGAIVLWFGIYITLVSWDMYKREKENRIS